MERKVMEIRRRHLRRRKPNRSKAGDIGIYLLLIFFGLFMAFPLVYAINSAFKPMDEIFVFPPKLFVKNPTLDNFQDLLVIMGKSWVPFSRYIFNTVFITTVGTAGHLLISSMGAYVLAKYVFPGAKTFFNIVVVALMFNGYVTAIPNYLIMSKIGWVDTVWAVVVPAFASPMGLFLMKQYMEGIPDALLEAAKIDGAHEWRIFTRIVMPMVKPAWLTLMILSVQGLWNTKASNFIYSEELKTLPYALQQIINGGVARAGVGAAVSLVMMVVPVTIFIVSESNIIETMASSGIKD
ncbi:MAG TPA: carbohydrate ABC transporter permease [Lachnospiraceae bacterium]|jgi:ABC-type glycerol-3-phosphate transport system permease component|nr:carbohydrate ABC transporter permease [Lachnospiraceae bacterium]HBY71101.1 carbohydrate ABC transporter permease [Lachnospiraceae bacterium]HCA70774.1 carbohydrate ABC transporter permease [Lachnospiraceae bacterium]HCM11914.1 carbohydrate ABC transporter permease [Lachnospiraceae bacterium]HCR40451.1 carbohydrate ABC transporter permease [Lachnospiraceae bacterium]